MGHHGHQQKVEKHQGQQEPEQNQKKHGHIGEAVGLSVALGAAAFAVHEHHQVKVDPNHAGRHRIEETVAGATALGVAWHELHKHNENHRHGLSH